MTLARAKSGRIGAALSWDGARVPVKSLSAAARTFLKGCDLAHMASQVPSQLLTSGAKEIRICWVPQLRGGEQTLVAPFVTLSGRRLSYRITQTKRFGDLLGVIYKAS